MIDSKTILISILILLLFYSCKNKCPSEITEEIAGTYKFNYPEGQIEVISIKNDLSFNQQIFVNEEGYVKGDTLYRNEGTWSHEGVVLRFDHWLVYCEFRNPDSVLVNPYIATMRDVSWCAPEANKCKGLINVYSESGYVFERIE
jgi:hypothetical protein